METEKKVLREAQETLTQTARSLSRMSLESRHCAEMDRLSGVCFMRADQIRQLLENDKPTGTFTDIDRACSSAARRDADETYSYDKLFVLNQKLVAEDVFSESMRACCEPEARAVYYFTLGYLCNEKR